ncbi:MAG: YdiU family protein [Hyphomicrobiales bacterium]
MIPFDNSYARLPEEFYAKLDPTPVEAPRLIKLNRPLCGDLGIDPEAFDTVAWAEIAAGNRVPDGAEPLAMAYAGHQFGQFVPQLGDGRAILLGEVIDRNGVRRDLQLKGSGPTPFSRRGDGRAALGPVLREYIVAEAMHAFGIPTTRALAAVTTGEPVYREEALPGAVLIRIASSHVRVGTFQYFTARRNREAVRQLADYVIDRHYPEARAQAQPYVALLEGVVARQAKLIARWMNVGFIHGVMNTDNMSIAGETIDYGPCAFMDAYDPATVFSSIDQMGRYAYANQPGIAQWNLARLAETLLPLLADDENAALAAANAAIGRFAELFETAWHAGLLRKLGLTGEDEEDLALVQALFNEMQAQGADFTLTFRRLGDSLRSPAARDELETLFGGSSAFADWRTAWTARSSIDGRSDAVRAQAMAEVNPLYIPRNHRVEQALAAAVRDADYRPFERLLTVLSEPFVERAGFEAYTQPAAPHERVTKTFCGT